MKISKKQQRELRERGLIPGGKLESVVVPVPPSANNLFPTNRTTGGRFCSKQYVKWKKEADNIICNLKSPDGYPCEVVIRCEVKLNGNRDLANIEKAITDACVRCGVIGGDKVMYISDIVMRYRPGTGDGVRVSFRKPSED